MIFRNVVTITGDLPWSESLIKSINHYPWTSTLRSKGQEDSGRSPNWARSSRVRSMSLREPDKDPKPIPIPKLQEMMGMGTMELGIINNMDHQLCPTRLMSDPVHILQQTLMSTSTFQMWIAWCRIYRVCHKDPRWITRTRPQEHIILTRLTMTRYSTLIFIF